MRNAGKTAGVFSHLARSPGRVRVPTCHPAKAIWRLGSRPMYAAARTPPRLRVIYKNSLGQKIVSNCFYLPTQCSEIIESIVHYH